MSTKNVFLAAATMLCAVSCSEYDGEYSYEELKMVSDVKAFTANFENRYGNIDSNHTWGFGNVTPVEPLATRTVNVNSNEWESVYKLNVPENISADEAEYVYNWFATNKLPKGKAIHWSDFFIQYVSSYNEKNNATSRNMDLLGYESLTGEWEHVNNFNVSTRAIQYVYNAGTENWTYRSSFDDRYHNDLYTIQWLSFDVNGKHYEGWYVGMDYEAIVIEGEGQERVGSVHADGYFNDWIVKVTPGQKKDSGHTRRIMCEDLGNTDDFDFNDVVFDVSYEEISWPEHKLYAIITLQAAGGTLPIYVGVNPSEPGSEVFEAHRLLGADSSSEPINVGEKSGIFAIYRIETTSKDPNDIPIYVINGSSKNTAQNVVIIPESGKGSDMAPQKICIPGTDTEWLLEMHQIEYGYKNFDLWVKNQNSQYGFDGSTPWNKCEEAIERSHLYK